MSNLNQKNKEVTIQFDTEDMTQTQVRITKTISALVAQLLTAEDESEYFELSAELLKKAAEAIKHSHFAIQNKDMCYGDQAVEFAIDFLNESVDQNKLGNIDN